MPPLHVAEVASTRRGRNVLRLSLVQRVVGYGGITLVALALFSMIRIDVTLPAYRRYIAGPAVVAS